MKTPWIVLCKAPPQGPPLPSNELRAECLRCKAGFVAALPLDLSELVKAMKAFSKKHQNCQPRFDGVCCVCGCTDMDCRQCIEKTGAPCRWVEPDLCSACV